MAPITTDAAHHTAPYELDDLIASWRRHLVVVAVNGVVHQPDEGAHLWQLLVAGQAPLIAYFALRWRPTARRPALVVLALQAIAVIMLAVAPVWALDGL
jgi:hypothetical protein